MKQLKFSYNWNKKLDCNAFTTIRLDSGLYGKDDFVEIVLNGAPIGTGIVMSVKKFFLKDLNEFVSYLDTGYSVQETKNIIQKMYPSVDFDKRLLSLILIVKQKK